MKSGIKDIAERICALREIMGFSPEEMAQATKTSVEEYMRMERGESDFSFTILTHVQASAVFAQYWSPRLSA